MIFDTHVHYDDPRFDEDRDELLESFRENGVGCVLNVGSDVPSLPKVMELAHSRDFIYAAIGIHPDEIGEITPGVWQEMRQYMADPKVVAAGEFGLDYYGEGKEDPKVRAFQMEWFRKQIELGREFQKPVLVHSREAAEDTMNIIREYYGDRKTEHPGIIHCYSYSPEQAKIYVGMGFLIGVGGIVTFRNSRKLKETVAQTDLDHLVLETDCPYLAPEPFRGTRNSSLNLPYVARAIAEIKGISEEEVIARTEQNAKTLFGIL